MDKTIKTYSDLCEERERLKNLLVVQKQRMKDDWDGLKHEMNPFKKVMGVFGKMTSSNKSNPLMSKGVKVATDLFITKFVLGKAGWLTKLAVPFVISNYSTHVIANKGQNFISRVATFLNNKRKYGIKERVPSASRSSAPMATASATNFNRGETKTGDNTAPVTQTRINEDLQRGKSDDLRQAANLDSE
jgi:hypothetical protein